MGVIKVSLAECQEQRGGIRMVIRSIAESDAENFVELSKEIDASGFMLHDPG